MPQRRLTPKALPKQPSIDQLRARIAELEAELALANAALDDPDFLAGRLERLLVDSPDLMMEARHIASSLRDAR